MNATQFRLMAALERSHWWYLSTHRLIKDLLSTLHPRPRNILDVGCGTGGLAASLSDFCPVTAMDPDPLAIRLARRRIKQGTVHFVTGGISSVPQMQPGSWDCITCVDVLYHRRVRSWRSALRVFVRALRPGGVLILQVPAFECLRGAHDDAVHGVRRFRRRPLLAALRRIGFAVELCTCRFAPTFPLVLASRLKERILGAAFRPDGDLRAFDFLPVWLGSSLNAVLLQVALMENEVVLSGGSFRFGSSLFVVARAAGSQRGEGA